MGTKIIGKFVSKEVLDKREAESKEAVEFIRKNQNTVNKRIDRIVKAGLQTESHAYRLFVEEKGKFGIRGKNHGQLMAEVQRMKGFLHAETSTIRGIAKGQKKIAKAFGFDSTKEDALFFKKNAAQMIELFSKLTQVMQMDSESLNALASTQIQDKIKEYIDTTEKEVIFERHSVEELVQKVDEYIKVNSKPLPVVTYGLKF